ncbi:MAG: glycosyltransferase family 39 protein [Solirubrobacterales bacterium]
MARQRSDLRPVAAACALTLLALVLRVLAARQSLGGDELFSLEVAARPGLGDVLDGVRGPLEITPPGYFVLGWAFAKLGDPTYWLKAPSVLAGTLTVPVAYAIGARTVGRWAGVVGAALLAISPYAIFYGSEARAYALTALAVAVATLLLLVALERRRWPRWAAFAAAVAASMYAHYVAAFPLAALLAWALWYHRDAWRPLLLAYAAAAVAYLPWIPGLLDDRTSPYQHAISRVWPFTLHYVGTALGQWTAGVPTWGVAKVPGPVALVLLGVGVLVLVGGLVVRRSRRRTGSSPSSSATASASSRSSAVEPTGSSLSWPATASASPRSSLVVLLVALAASGPVLAALWSLFEPSVFVPRTFVASLPALALLVGAGVVAVPRVAAIAAAACLVVGLGLGTARTLDDFRRPPFRAAADYIDARARPGQPVLESGFFDPGALEADLDPRRPVFRVDCSNASTGPGQILTARVHCGEKGSGIAPARAAGRRAGRLWLVSWGGPPAAEPGFTRVSLRRFDGGLGVWVAEDKPA